MTRRRWVMGALGGTLLLVAPAVAADYESGREAYAAGDFGAAHAAWIEAGVAGDAEAQYAVGVMLANGTGVSRDLISAYAWLVLAAKGGIGDAEDKHKSLLRDHIPRYCHYDALGLLRQFETGHRQALAAGGRQKSRCWRF